MPVKYNKQLSKNGAAIGSVMTVVRPDDYTSSNTESIEASNWQISRDYPGWLECDGRTLNISEYRALYSVIGTTYGGDGVTTFRLPDYRSKKVCGTGALDGNRGGSLTLTPTRNALGLTGNGTSDEAGSTGGLYTLSTVRQLPEGSEITSGTPSSPVSIGGNAVDTFSLGTFRSQGFSSVVVVAEPVLTGTVSFGVGPVRDASVSGVPLHTHDTTTVDVGNRTAHGAPQDPKDPFVQEAQGSVLSFNRTRRPWPGNADGFGDFFFYQPVDALPSGGNTLTLGPGTVVRSYGPGTSETNGFSNPGGNAGSSYLAFGGDTGPFVQNRSATFRLNAANADTFVILAIGGNDANGGERVNSQFDSLKISFGGGASSILLESSWVFYNPTKSESGTSNNNDGFESYDAYIAAWKEFTFTIPAANRVNNLQVTLTQNVNPSTGTGFWDGSPAQELSGAGTDGDQNPPQNVYDSFGIAKVGLLGSGGDSFDYTSATSAVPLQRHSHMVYWNTPNIGEVVPEGLSTYGTGNGSNNRLNVNWTTNPLTITQATGDGLRRGAAATESVTTNNSVGDSISKTINVVTDIGNNVNPSIVTLSDSSRTVFDNSIDVRLQAAEPITLLTPYFRAKYLIKAF
jgi:microcystin-dependent protein